MIFSSEGPSRPKIVGLPTGVVLCIFESLQNIGILGGLGVCESHFLVMSSSHPCDRKKKLTWSLSAG